MADLENIRIETETDGEIEDITIVTQKTFHTILSSSVAIDEVLATTLNDEEKRNFKRLADYFLASAKKPAGRPRKRKRVEYIDEGDSTLSSNRSFDNESTGERQMNSGGSWWPICTWAEIEVNEECKDLIRRTKNHQPSQYFRCASAFSIEDLKTCGDATQKHTVFAKAVIMAYLIAEEDTTREGQVRSLFAQLSAADIYNQTIASGPADALNNSEIHKHNMHKISQEELAEPTKAFNAIFAQFDHQLQSRISSHVDEGPSSKQHLKKMIRRGSKLALFCDEFGTGSLFIVSPIFTGKFLDQRFSLSGKPHDYTFQLLESLGLRNNAEKRKADLIGDAWRKYLNDNCEISFEAEVVGR